MKPDGRAQARARGVKIVEGEGERGASDVRAERSLQGRCKKAKEGEEEGRRRGSKVCTKKFHNEIVFHAQK